MNHRLFLPRHAHWRKDLQFAVGVMVALGGAGALLARLIQHLGGA